MTFIGKQLSDFVQISQRYQRSALVESDSRTVEGVNGYVVSPASRDLALRIARELAAGGRTRAWTIVGPYGSGKSSFSTWLAMLLEANEAPLRAAAMAPFNGTWREFRPELDSSLRQLDPGLTFAIVTGQRASLGLLVLQAVHTMLLRAALPDTAPIGEVARLLGKLESEDRVLESAIVDAVVAASRALAVAGGGGLALVIDELGKVLEWVLQDLARTDLYLLQLLAEAASREKQSKLLLITVVHQSFETYAHGATAAVRAEVAKIEGRFEIVPFLESVNHVTQLVSDAILPSAIEVTLPAQVACNKLCERLIGHYGEHQLPEFGILFRCFPLNPVTAVSLGPLFRLKLGQNERSVFAFLGSSEPHGFRQFLESAQASHRQLFTLAGLYDYVVANTGVRFQLDSGERSWAAVEQAISRVPLEDDEVTTSVLKAIGILSLVSRTTRLRADARTLSIALDLELAAVERVLELLQRRSIVVYREFRAAYQIWDGSDLDIPAELRKKRSEIAAAGRLGDKLQEFLPPPPLVATRHGHETGTMRCLTASYLSAATLLASATRMPAASGDGELILIVPENAQEFDEAKERALQIGRQTHKRPMIFGLPRDWSALCNVLLDFFAISETMADLPGLDADPVAKRELTERKLASQDSLVSQLQRDFGDWPEGQPSRWIFDKRELLNADRQSKVASVIFDKVYKAAPKIRNELINRAELSAVAAKARRELMERLLDQRVELNNLDIKGHPPELSVYLSVLKESGLHGPSPTGKFELRRNGTAKDSKKSFEPIWDRIKASLEAAKGGRRNLADLVVELEQPPFGIREGVSLILLLVYYVTGEDDLFLYEENSLVPRPQGDIVHRMVRKPSSIEFQYVGGHSAAQASAGELWDRIQERARPTSGLLLRVVRSLVRTVNELSPFAGSTQRVSETARRLRAAVKSARDPIELLTIGLPNAVAPDAGGSKTLQQGETANLIRDALAELQAADSKLLRSVVSAIGTHFGCDAEPVEVCRTLARRAATVNEAKEISPELRRFAGICAEFGAENSSDWVDWAQGVATAVMGKQPSNWKDEDFSRFEYATHNLARQFRATETIAIEASGGSIGGKAAFRLAVLDAAGQEHTMVAVDLGIAAGVVDAVEAALVAAVKDNEISESDLYVALARVLARRFSNTSYPTVAQ